MQPKSANGKKQAVENIISGFKNSSKNKKIGDENLVKELYEQISQLSVQCDWLKKNLNYLDLEVRCNMISTENTELSISRQCSLLAVNRSSYYYKPSGLNTRDLEIMKIIDEIYTENPYYGTCQMSKCIQIKGLGVGRKVVSRYYRKMALEVIYPKPHLSKRNQEHKVYPYLLQDIDIIRINQVWSADITYIRLSKPWVLSI